MFPHTFGASFYYITWSFHACILWTCISIRISLRNLIHINITVDNMEVQWLGWVKMLLRGRKENNWIAPERLIENIIFDTSIFFFNQDLYNLMIGSSSSSFLCRHSICSSFIDCVYFRNIVSTFRIKIKMIKYKGTTASYSKYNKEMVWRRIACQVWPS